MVPILTPFAKLANSILPIDSNGILVLRDNAENVKRMLQMIDRVDVSVPAEYISEVIPIKYALADDIASALNSLGGTGGGTVSIGSSRREPASSGNGFGGGTTGACAGGAGGYQGGNGLNSGGQQRGYGGATTPNGTPSGSSFQQTVAIHHLESRRCRGPAGSNPGFRPDENHRRRAEQFTADLCDAAGHGRPSTTSSPSWTCCSRRCSSNRSSWKCRWTRP